MLAEKIEVLEEDAQILVVYKPAGIPVQSKGVGVQDLEHMLLGYLADHSKQKGKQPYLAVIHRLDQPVEGILVFGKTPKAAAALNGQLTDGRMKKYYQAVTGNQIGSPKGRLENWLLKDGGTNTSRIVPAGTGGAKKAVLEYSVLETGSCGSLLEIELHTGRHHQIRVQMAENGMALVGDRKYGGAENDGALALCACRLSFVHPGTGERKNYRIIPRNPIFGEFQYNKEG